MILSARANNIKCALAEARRVGGFPLKGNREVLRSGGDDNLWRVTLESGHVVEVTTARHARSEAYILE